MSERRSLDRTVSAHALPSQSDAPSVSPRTGSRRSRASIVPTVSVIAGRYELTAMLGAGGMGTVFRAHDLELDEVVALKVLDPDLVDSIESLGRFKAEVKLARRVTHRNVARTFDFGTHGELRFLTMEYVDGVSLHERVYANPMLGMDEVVGLTKSILQGLAAAHGAGVVHRDLKPANVMLGRDGRVLLMDFGIAHALESSESERRTKSGMVGTPLYMSPEHVEGARDLDGRSDLYSLGLMVHEMLAREVPFDGPSPFAVAAARLLRPPPKLQHPDAPPWFSALVDRLVATRREDRPASAQEALGQFVAPSTSSLVAAAHVGSTHVFVEPAQTALKIGVVTLASDERSAEIGRTLTEELAELLASTPRAQVLLGAPLAGELPRDVGRRLGVDLVLEGQISEADSVFAVRLRLVTVAEGFLLFATRTKDSLTGLPRWVEGAASGVAAALETKVAVVERSPTDALTLDLYFRGRSEFHKRWRESALLSRELLSKAYERAPDDPMVVSAYALLLTRMFGFGGEVDQELAARMVQRANTLAPGRADAMMASAGFAFQVGDLDRTASMLHEVLARSPQHPDALDLLGRILAETGPADEALRVIAMAAASDPKLVSTPLEVARIAALSGNWARAEACIRELERIDVPSALIAFGRHRILKLWRGERSFDEELERAAKSPSSFAQAERDTLLHFVAASKAPTPELLAALPQNIRVTLVASERQVRKCAFNAQVRAEVFALHGLWDEVLTELELANQHALFDELWIEGLVLFAPLRGTPRFEAVRTQVLARAASFRAKLPLAGARPHG